MLYLILIPKNKYLKLSQVFIESPCIGYLTSSHTLCYLHEHSIYESGNGPVLKANLPKSIFMSIKELSPKMVLCLCLRCMRERVVNYSYCKHYFTLYYILYPKKIHSVYGLWEAATLTLQNKIYWSSASSKLENWFYDALLY